MLAERPKFSPLSRRGSSGNAKHFSSSYTDYSVGCGRNFCSVEYRGDAFTGSRRGAHNRAAPGTYNVSYETSSYSVPEISAPDAMVLPMPSFARRSESPRSIAVEIKTLLNINIRSFHGV